MAPDFPPVKIASIEELCLILANATAYDSKFAIEYIRWDAFFQHDRALSYKQVRNAIFRLRAKGFPIRHICRGVYKWLPQ